MKIAVCGLGKWGHSFIGILSELNCEVVVVDESLDAIQEVLNVYDVKAYLGRPTNIKVLNDAGIKDFDAVLALTDIDEINMIICSICHVSFNITVKIAMIIGDDYREICKLMNIDVLFDPAFELASYIKNHFIHNYDRMNFGDVKVMVIDINKESLLNFFSKEAKSYVGILRGEELLLSKDDDLQFGDKLILCSIDEEVISEIEDHILSGKAGKLVLIGAGRVGVSLVKQLGVKNFKSVIDKDSNAAQILVDAYSSLEVICGDALYQDTLEEVGLAKGDTVFAVTGDDRSNIIISILAMQMGAGLGAALINSKYMKGAIYEKLGLINVLNPSEVLGEKLLGCITFGSYRSLSKCKGGIVCLHINSENALKGIISSYSKFWLAVERDSQILLPHLCSDFHLKVGDSLLVYLDRGQLSCFWSL